jgi:hypothetical protein
VSAVTCVCGKVCASRSGFATHADACPVEQGRSRAFVEAIEAGRSGVEASAAFLAEQHAVRLA